VQERFQTFVTEIANCHRCIQRIKAAEMTEFGLKGTHVMCLFFLCHHPQGLTASELTQLCAEDKAAISRAVSTLQEKGYVVSSGKKYRALLQLTPEGHKLSERIERLIEQWVGFGGDGISAEERTVFYRVLEHISQNLRSQLEQNQQGIQLGKEL